MKGQPIKHRTTWRPKSGMSRSQAEREVKAFAYKFEEYIHNGYQYDDNKTFAQYADYVLDLKARNEKGIYEGPPKNGQVRAVKLAPQSLALLKKHKLEQTRLRLLNGDRWVNSGYVFTKDNGQCMHPDSITDWLNRFSKKHDLPHIHPHAFRHTAASTMIANGVDLVTTAAELGHADATTTAMIYAHQIARQRAKAADIRAGVFSCIKVAK